MAIFMFDAACTMNVRRFAIVVPRFPLPFPTPPGEDYIAEPARLMHEQGFTVEILTTHRPDTPGSSLPDAIPVRRFGAGAGLLHAIRCGGYDLIHAHSDFRPSVLSGLLADGSRTILTRHSYVLPGAVWKRRLLVGLMNRFDRVIALTTYERDVYRAAGVDESRIAVVPHGVNVPFFADGGDAARFRAKWKLDPGSPLILFVANLRRVKNPHTVFRAFQRVVKEQPSARLIVIGKDLLPQEGAPSAAALARQAGVEAVTTFTDWLDGEELRDALAAATVVVNSSANESFLLAAQEAAAASRPLCLPQIGSLQSLFGPNALYHEPADDASLATNIRRYLTDPSLAETHAKANRATVQQFDLPGARKQLLGLYWSTLAGRATVA